MKEITYGSEKARLNWRDMLDAALRGMKVTIERYGKPSVVVVAHDVFEELERRAAMYDSSPVALAQFDKSSIQVAEEDVKASMGPLDELYQLVESEDEWYAIIERARLRAGLESSNENKELMYAEIEKELPALRQRKKAAR